MWRYQPRGHPKGAAGPEGCPQGRSRHTRSGKPLKHEHGQKYWHYFLCMDNHPTGWPLLYETPLGMICLYEKVMLVETRMKLYSKMLSSAEPSFLFPLRFPAFSVFALFTLTFSHGPQGRNPRKHDVGTGPIGYSDTG